MRNLGVVLLSILVILGAVLSGFAVVDPLPTGASEKSVVDATEPSHPLAKPADRRRLEPGKVERWRDLCTGSQSIRLKQSKLCTHGPDKPPVGFAMNQPVPALSARTVRRETAGIPCSGDGESGYRVQILYVRGSNVGSRYSQMLPSFRAWAGAANQIFQQSAVATGGVRSLRFVHDSACLPIVAEAVVSPDGDDAFGTMIAELKNQGYDRSDRIYLTFVDTDDAGICGIGSLWNDDRASEDNWNNFGPSFARVDSWCWSGKVAAHELMHNLGGVQDSAPNSSGGFHCIDEYDVMCYRDSSHSPQMRYDCPDPLEDETQFDCGHQDYYNTDPLADSYLANFWNAANNQFLTGAPNISPPTEQKNEKEHKKHKKHKRHHSKHLRH